MVDYMDHRLRSVAPVLVPMAYKSHSAQAQACDLVNLGRANVISALGIFLITHRRARN